MAPDKEGLLSLLVGNLFSAFGTTPPQYLDRAAAPIFFLSKLNNISSFQIWRSIAYLTHGLN